MKRLGKLRPVFATLYLVCFVMFVFLTVSPVLNTHAEGDEPDYSSWVKGTAYDTSGVTKLSLSDDEAYEDDAKEKIAEAGAAAETEEISSIEKMLSKLPKGIGTAISSGLKTFTGVDMTMTGIVMGSVNSAAATPSSFFVFDLSGENVYGMGGSVIYIVTRNIASILLFLAALYKVIKAIWNGNSRAGQVFKDSLIVFGVGLAGIYLMPLVVDWVCNARDALIVIMYKAEQSWFGANATASIANSIETAYLEAWEKQQSFVNGVIYMIVCFMPIYYATSYIKVAVTQLILFGMFPFFEAYGILDGKKTTTSWIVTFVTNCFVPCIDIVLLMLPSLVCNMIVTVTGDEVGFNKSLVKAIIVCTMFFAVIPTRNMILSMFGNNFTSQLGPGMGLANAIRAAGRTAMALGGMALAAGKAGAGLLKAQNNKADEYHEHEKALQSDRAIGGESKVNEKSNTDSVPGASKGETKNDFDNASGYSGSENNGDKPISTAKADGGDEGAGGSAKSEGDSPIYNDNPSGGDSESGSSVLDSVEGISSNASYDDSAPPSLADDIKENSFKDLENGIDHTDFNMSRAENLKEMEDLQSESRNIDALNASLMMQNSKIDEQLKNDASDRQKYAEEKTKAEGEIHSLKEQAKRAGGAQQTDTDGVKFQDKIDAATARKNEAWDKMTAAQERINNHDAMIQTKQSNIEQMARNSARKAEVNAKLQDASAKEQHFANQMANTGRSGKTYDNAQDFARDLKTQANLAKVVSYKDFTDRKYDGVLSDAQRIQFQRRAEFKQVQSQALNDLKSNAKVVASAGVAAVGMAAAVGSGDANELARASGSYNAAVSGQESLFSDGSQSGGGYDTADYSRESKESRRLQRSNRRAQRTADAARQREAQYQASQGSYRGPTGSGSSQNSGGSNTNTGGGNNNQHDQRGNDENRKREEESRKKAQDRTDKYNG